MDDLSGFYQSHINTYKQKLAKLKQQLLSVATFRLIAFVGLGLSLYYYLRLYQAWLLACCFVLLIIFLLLVKFSTSLTQKKILNTRLLWLNENELQLLEGRLNQFGNGLSQRTDNGYHEDLDIFGQGSLYHLINRTNTPHGADALSSLLVSPLLLPADIVDQQQAIQALGSQHEVRQLIMASGMFDEGNNANLGELSEWLEQPFFAITNKWLMAARYLLPALNLGMLILSLSTGQLAFISASVFISWLHVGYAGKYVTEQYVALSKKQPVLVRYAGILQQFEYAETGTSEKLKAYRQTTLDAHKQIKKLAQLANLLDQRLNLIVNLLLNSFAVYEVQCLILIEKWKQQNKAHLQEWIATVAQIETLTSLATYAFNHAENVYPTLADTLTVQGKRVYHPLIPKAMNISNDVDLGNTSSLLLITGSNMSGKTTYLRTIGVNTVMAQCGLPVCADAFYFCPVRILTSIKISDSLRENTSYFMAELTRLHWIKESLRDGTPSLVLIDEILRGTNSDDKYYGSAQFVQQLIRYNCLALFATHDLKLSELETDYPGRIENYCFESVIENNELIFDYKALRGVAKNKNASFLMEKMGII